MQREWLIQKRNKLNLTQQEVADLSNVSRPYYTMIEQGIRNPSVPSSKAIAKTLSFDWTYFFEEKGNEMTQLKEVN